MTISTELRKAGPFTGNGATTGFPFSFKVFAATDVTVTVANTQGSESVLALGADYAVALNADQDAAPGGTVTLAAPLASGHRLVVSSTVPNLQPTDITNSGGFYPRVIEDALDRHVAQIQQIDEKVGRALKVAVTSPLGGQALPSPVAGMLIGWNESNDGLKNYAPIGGALLGQQLAAANGSSLVGFQQAGTGAVVRTAQDKLREWVNLKDFGAVGDGVTDDTQACKLAADYLRARGGGTLHISNGTYCVWTALPSHGEVLFDWTGCRGVTVIYSNSKILAVRPNTATGDAVTAIIHGLENVQRFTAINPAAEQVGSVIPANGGIVQFGVGMAGGANQSSGIKIINARQIGGLGGLIVYPSGAPNDRAHTIEMDGYFEGVYYPQNFQGNGDNYRGRVTTRNCGRSYFPYNVAGHDVYVDSNNGTAFDDINISAYTATTLRAETSGIKVRYRNYGSASLGNAVHFGLIQSDGVSRAAQIRDVTVELDMQVGTYPGMYVTAKKYDSSGAADNTARGHSFMNVEIRGSALGSAALNPVQFFNTENWTGESVYGLRFRDLQVTSQTAGGQKWVIDGRGIKTDGGGVTFENVFTNVPISKTNMPHGVQTIRNVAESGVQIDGGVGNWTRSYMPHGLCLLTYIGGISVPNGAATTLTLPFADKRGANPHVVITPKGVQCKFTATALTAQTFSISHDHTASVAFDVFVLAYV